MKILFTGSWTKPNGAGDVEVTGSGSILSYYYYILAEVPDVARGIKKIKFSRKINRFFEKTKF